jgi:zinc D-Ala-D-Ala carboxypeptidase
MTDWNKYPNFESHEFDSPDLPGSGENMVESFMDKLQKARNIAGIVFTINSGVRSVAHNSKVGGSPNSSHMAYCAADIKCRNSHERQLIVCALVKAGFVRIGIARTFVHCDTDNTKNPAIWLY